MRLMMLAVVAGLSAGSAEAVTLINGSFEDGPSAGGSLIELATGDTTSLPGWTVRANGVSVAESPFWTASDGNRSVRLATTAGGGGVFQQLDGFVVGNRYQLAFDLSGDPYDTKFRPNDKRVIVSASSGVPQLFTYTLTDANTPTAMGWQRFVYDFVAQTSKQTILFQGSSPDEFGPVLDNVTLAVVPEPASWAMLIAGFGLVGAARRRRQPVVAA